AFLALLLFFDQQMRISSVWQGDEMRIRFIVSALGAVVVALAVGCGGGQGGGHNATSVAPSPTPSIR
ncbi:hypothetical protein, partial [Mycobacterium sp. E3247]|uniref:hypothetical protein n=1 Tax=Mycobacterium sp. E3247 TaxID=1856864 RepID=UPI003513845A